MTFVAIIPAREGSKRLKNKNLRLLNRKPLIHYSINAAKKSKYIKDIILFTDSQKIKKIYYKDKNVFAPSRPKHLSTDNVSMLHTVYYLIKKYNLKKKYKYLVLLQPTSPQRTHNDIDKAIEKLLKNKKADTIISSFKIDKLHPNRVMFQNGKYLILNKKIKWKKNSEVFSRNGPSVLVTKINKITKKNFYEKGKILNYIMPSRRSIDIDDIKDFKKLQKIF